MGSPVVAIVGLVLGYTMIYAGIKNLSIIKAFQGIETPAQSASSLPTGGATQLTDASNIVVAGGTGAGVVKNTAPVNTPGRVRAQ